MANLTDVINNIETTRFDATGADDPSAYGQPYWGIDMEDVTDKTLRGIVDELSQFIKLALKGDKHMRVSFDKWLSAPYKSSTYKDAIRRLDQRVVINKNGWTYEDVEYFNAIFYSFVQVLNAFMATQYNAPKEIIIVQYKRQGNKAPSI